jgi:anti-sigma-K factor RskA
VSAEDTPLSGHERYRDDLAAYALGALDEREEAALRRHMEECEACRTRLRWLRPAVDLLPRTVEQLEPPPGLGRRLMAAVRAEAPPMIRTDAPGPTRGRPWDALWRPAVAVGAAALIVAGAIGGYLLRQPEEQVRVTAARPLAGAGPVAGALERRDDSAILTMSELPPLRRGEVYEVWVQRGDQMEPSSLFVPHRDRSAAAAVPGSLEDADAVLITREPSGGSRRPTSRPLLRAELQ